MPILPIFKLLEASIFSNNIFLWVINKPAYNTLKHFNDYPANHQFNNILQMPVTIHQPKLEIKFLRCLHILKISLVLHYQINSSLTFYRFKVDSSC